MLKDFLEEITGDVGALFDKHIIALMDSPPAIPATETAISLDRLLVFRLSR